VTLTSAVVTIQRADELRQSAARRRLVWWLYYDGFMILTGGQPDDHLVSVVATVWRHWLTTDRTTHARSQSPSTTAILTYLPPD